MRACHAAREHEARRGVRATGPSDRSERAGDRAAGDQASVELHNSGPASATQCPAPARARMRARPCSPGARSIARRPGPAALPLRCEGEGERRAMTIWKVWLTERRSRSWASWKDGLDGGGRDDDGLEGGKGGGQHGSELHVDGRVVDRGGGGGHRSYCLRRQGHWAHSASVRRGRAIAWQRLAGQTPRWQAGQARISPADCRASVGLVMLVVRGRRHGGARSRGR